MKVVKVKGLNLNRYLSEVVSIKILPQNIIRPCYDEIIFEISDNEYKKLVANKISTCYNINVIKEYSSHPILFGVVKRIGLFVGLIAMMVVMFSNINRVWAINISVLGESTEFTQQSVLEILESNGVKIGQKFEISTRELEKQIISRVDECSNVVIKKNGFNVDVMVTIRVNKPEQTNTDIVAGYSGVITDINLTSGILLANIGEGVGAGQVLIASGLVGDYYHEAIGEINAKVLISGTAVGSTCLESAVKTGNEKQIIAYQIFGKTFYSGDSIEDAKKMFDCVEVEKEEKILFENAVIPVKKIIYKVYEVKIQLVEKNKSELVDELKGQAYTIAKNGLPQGAIEGAVSYDVFDENGIIKVVCNIETEINIAKRSEKQ